MIASSNYIKIKSRRLLRRQIRASEQATQIAGTNDISNNPGSVSPNSPLQNPTGVNAPNSFSVTEAFYGESLSLNSAGSGLGSVQMPPEQPRAPISSDGLGPRYKIATTIRDMLRPTNPNLPGSEIQAGSNLQNPLGSGQAGNMSEELERTTSIDGYRSVRTRDREKRRVRRRYY